MLENELEFKPLGGTRLVLTIDRALCSVHVDGLWDSDGCPQDNPKPSAGDLAALEKAFAAVKASLLASEQESDLHEIKQLDVVDVRTDVEKPAAPEVPEISLPDLAEAQEKLAQLQQLADMVASKPKEAPAAPAAPVDPTPPVEDEITSFDFALSTKEPPPAPADGKPVVDILDAYRSEPMGSKGQLSRREARSQIQWLTGMDYKGAGKVIQCGVDERDDNPHGAFWTLTLDNGDVVTTDLLGKELSYDCAEDSKSPEWMDPSDELPAVPAASIPKPFDILSVPDSIAKVTPTHMVLDWLLDTIPALENDMERCIALCVKYAPKLRTFTGMTEDKIRRRVETILPVCIAKRPSSA